MYGRYEEGAITVDELFVMKVVLFLSWMYIHYGEGAICMYELC